MVLRLGIQLLEQLETCHQLGIIHNDLKPANIMVDEDGKASIIDFGACRSYLNENGDHYGSKELVDAFAGNCLFSHAPVLNFQYPTRSQEMVSLGYVLLFIMDELKEFAFSFL